VCERTGAQHEELRSGAPAELRLVDRREIFNDVAGAADAQKGARAKQPGLESGMSVKSRQAIEGSTMAVRRDSVFVATETRLQTGNVESHSLSGNLSVTAQTATIRLNDPDYIIAGLVFDVTSARSEDPAVGRARFRVGNENSTMRAIGRSATGAEQVK